ncbi:hypothetical protein FKM82_020980 [Ascaphus truei]
MLLSSTSLAFICNSLHAPMKLVPQSERICLTCPLIAKNLLKAFMKLDASIDSMTSMCMARVHIQVKSTAHRLLSASPPLVLHEMTVHGPKTLSPTQVKGGSVLILAFAPQHVAPNTPVEGTSNAPFSANDPYSCSDSSFCEMSSLMHDLFMIVMNQQSSDVMLARDNERIAFLPTQLGLAEATPYSHEAIIIDERIHRTYASVFAA